jgi:ferredoxin/multimeric flavodoxin WrbA
MIDMKWVTFFFSGTGNTWWVTQQFSRIAQTKGIDSTEYSIEQLDFNDPTKNLEILSIIEESDMVGFAYPIYGANMPAIMQRFIKKLSDFISKSGKNIQKSVYLLTSVGYMNSYGPFAARTHFKQLGWKIRAHAMVRIAMNISEPKMNTRLLPLEKLEKRKEGALKFLEKWVSKLLQGKRWLHGVGPWLLAGKIVKKVLQKSIAMNYSQIVVDITKCTKCLQCVKQCPTHAIIYENEKFLFNNKCTACMRCYNFCPMGAIGINNLIADLKEYPRYKGPVTEFHPKLIIK